MSIELKILGCGNSEGTPSIGNNWGKCNSDQPKNRRLRPSVWVRSEETSLIIDTGPDFKEQVNQNRIDKIDGVLYTHAHGDHINGIDELRVWAKLNGESVNIYAHHETMEELKKRFDYHFEQKSPLYPAVVSPHLIKNFGKPMKIGDIDFIPFEQDHGTCTSLGFRFGDLAYSTDLSDLSDFSVNVLKGIKTWIVDAAGYNWGHNIAHLTIERLYKLNDRIQAQKVYITHLSRFMDYETLTKELRHGYQPAYDGLSFTIA